MEELYWSGETPNNWKYLFKDMVHSLLKKQNVYFLVESRKKHHQRRFFILLYLWIAGHGFWFIQIQFAFYFETSIWAIVFHEKRCKVKTELLCNTELMHNAKCKMAKKGLRKEVDLEGGWHYVYKIEIQFPHLQKNRCSGLIREAYLILKIECPLYFRKGFRIT